MTQFPNDSMHPIVDSLGEVVRVIGAYVEDDQATIAAFDAEREARAAQVRATDLRHELGGAVAVADELVTHSNEVVPADPRLDAAARMAVLEVGQIDVDVRNLPAQ